MAEELPEFLVRFSLRVKAENPGDAVDGVIDLLVEKGLRDWVYRVESPALAPGGMGGLIGYYDGYGVAVDVDALLDDSEPVEPIPVSGPDPATESEDEDLLAEAQLLNQTNE